MNKSNRFGRVVNPEWATVSNRIGWLLETRFHGNRSAMAKRIGFSHTIIARVVGGANPGPRLRDAIATHLHVDPDWLRTGKGQPFAVSATDPSSAMPVSGVLLPGPPQHHQDQIIHWITVPEVVSSPSRYWLTLRAVQPIVRQPSSGFRTGDHLLMETDPAKFPSETDLFDHLCVLRSLTGGVELRLAMVRYYPASIDDGDARLEADVTEPAETEKQVVEHVYRHYPDGEVRHQARRSPVAENRSLVTMPPFVRYTDIVSVWLKVLRRPSA